jgi:hypothetical protein
MGSPLDIPIGRGGHWLWRTLIIYILIVLVALMAVAAAAELPVSEVKHVSIVTDDLLEQDGNISVYDGCEPVNVTAGVLVNLVFSAPNSNSTNVPYYVSVVESSESGPFVGVAGEDGYANVQNVTLAVVVISGEVMNACVTSLNNASYSLTESYAEPWGQTW